jgi:NAD(P)-dependent dehydrogenase (short-subunit alcohol dehydrogenase family)
LKKNFKMELRNAVAIITGGGRGIGRTTAVALAKENCKIVISSRSREELTEVATLCEKLNAEILPLCLDLSDISSVDELVDKSIERFGKIDILVNNAGIIVPRPFTEISLEEWDQTMDINLRSVFYLSKQVWKKMISQRSGYIINISSTVALAVPSHLGAYGASKTGVVGLNQALYETAKEYGIKVSCIYPGITDTKMVRDIRPSTKPEQWMLPEDITDCILFLLKTNSRMVIKDLVPWSTGHDKI